MGESEQMPKRTTSQHDTDIIIVGAGLAGLTFGLLLARAGIRTTIIDRQPLTTQTTRAFDVRTTAIAAGSARVLQAAGVWGRVVDCACPITTIEILDGPRDGADWPVLLNFDSTQVGDQPFGWIVDNQDLRIAQADALAEEKNLTLLAPATITDIVTDAQGARITLRDGRAVTGALLIGADGRASAVRDHFRIRTRGWPYDHTAIVCTVRHSGRHDQIAIEHFQSSGPFAALPMTDDVEGCPRSGIVWSERPHTARRLMALDDAAFALALTARLPDRYGDLTLVGKRAAFPLSLQHAERYTDTRMALIADAAHGIHPIAGQGLNLGMRDVADLADLLITAHQNGDDLGAPDILAAYERRRRADNMGMIGATDTLTGLFGAKWPGVGAARRLGLRLVEQVGPMKRFFIRQAMGGTLATQPYAWDQAA